MLGANIQLSRLTFHKVMRALYSRTGAVSIDFVTNIVSTLGNVHTHLYVAATELQPVVGSVRIAAYMGLPEILGEFGIDVPDVLREAGVRADIFSDPENLITYPDVGRLLSISSRQTRCDYIGLLLGQRSDLASMGLAGQVALSRDTAREGLQSFAHFFSLHNTAATVSVITGGEYTRLVYAVAEPRMDETGQIQLGAMALGFNILRQLCGPKWLPVTITVATAAPANLKPCQKFFRAAVCFDSTESALVFESHWLDRALPPLDPLRKRQIEAEVRARQAAVLADFPAVVRRTLRKQLIIGDYSMDRVGAIVGMHRRTLDRRLKQYGLLYGEMLGSVKLEVACQLLRDTQLGIQQIAESLRYTSAANFSTAFRRWTGATPSAYRRKSASDHH